MKSRLSLWMATILLGSVIGVLFALPNLSAGNYWRLLQASLIQWWSWGLIAPLIVWMDGRLPFKENQLFKRVLAHLPLSVLVTLLTTGVAFVLADLTGLQTWAVMMSNRLLAERIQGVLWSWLVYWIIFGLLQTFRYYQHYLAGELRMVRMERSSSEARLNALRMQLDPHFLFNALNTISAQVESDPRLARAMIEHLGDLLRLSLDARNRRETSLAEELAFLDHYIAIQKLRFADSLRIDIQVDPAVKHALVPGLILQPLVENAIRHGISRRASGGTITVTAAQGAGLEIRVADDGVGLPPGWTLDGSLGTGLSVTRERILGLHPNGDSDFIVRPREGGGTQVEISLPLRWAGAGEGG